MEGPPVNIAGQHDKRIPASSSRLVESDLATRFIFQKCQKSNFSNHDNTQPLPVVVQRQNHPIYGQVSEELSNDNLKNGFLMIGVFRHDISLVVGIFVMVTVLVIKKLIVRLQKYFFSCPINWNIVVL